MEDDMKRVYGRCRACSGLVVYFHVERRLYYYANGDLHSAHPVDFLADPSANPNPKISNESSSPMKQGRVIQRVTDAGCYYRGSSRKRWTTFPCESRIP